MVKPGRAVAGKVLGIGGAVLAVLAAAYIFRNTDAGTKVLESLKGAGGVAGQSILAPIQGLIEGVSAGTGSLVQASAAIGSNLGSFADAVAAGDFASIADGSYITKYAGPGPKPNALTNPQQDFTKTTIRDESPNGTSSAASNFSPAPVSIFNIEDILRRKKQSTAISNLSSNLAATRASIAAKKGTINISGTGVNFQSAAQALIARLRG